MFDRSSIELRFVFDRTSLWYRLESKEVTKVTRKRSSHVPPKYLPSTSHFLILWKGREKGRKKEEKECWRGRREYYAFRDEYLPPPEVTSIFTSWNTKMVSETPLRVSTITNRFIVETLTNDLAVSSTLLTVGNCVTICQLIKPSPHSWLEASTRLSNE